MRATLQAVHPVLGAIDVAELVQFYECLGFVVVFQDAPTDPKYVAVKRDGVELHIQWADKGQWSYSIDRPAFRFLVSNVDAVYGEFAKSGGASSVAGQDSPWATPTNTPWGTREFHLRDPSQNSLQFYRPL